MIAESTPPTSMRVASLAWMILNESPSTLEPPKTVVAGWIRFSTNAVISAVTALPMTTPTARSMTLPCMTKSLKPFMGSSLRGRGCEEEPQARLARDSSRSRGDHGDGHDTESESVSDFSRPCGFHSDQHLRRRGGAAAERALPVLGHDHVDDLRGDSDAGGLRRIGDEQHELGARLQVGHQRPRHGHRHQRG